MYLHLARASQQRRRPLVRDKMLLLAGAIAAEQGLMQVAACCRQRVLAHNAGHLIGQYATFSAALADERFQTFLRKLRRDFPQEKAEHMLDSLGIQLAGERETYYTTHEYAASLLGVSTDELDRSFGVEEPPSEEPQAQDAPGEKSSSEPAIICRPPTDRTTTWFLFAMLVAGLIATVIWLVQLR
jgi:hypothetical protein